MFFKAPFLQKQLITFVVVLLDLMMLTELVLHFWIHMSIYIAWCFAKQCQIRAEPSKGSYAKEWAQWEQRLRVTLFGNADHLNSIQVTIFHLLTIQDHNGCWMFILHILTRGATTNLRRLRSLQESFLLYFTCEDSNKDWEVTKLCHSSPTSTSFACSWNKKSSIHQCYELNIIKRIVCLGQNKLLVDQ